MVYLAMYLDSQWFAAKETKSFCFSATKENLKEEFFCQKIWFSILRQTRSPRKGPRYSYTHDNLF